MEEGKEGEEKEGKEGEEEEERRKIRSREASFNIRGMAVIPMIPNPLNLLHLLSQTYSKKLK